MAYLIQLLNELASGLFASDGIIATFFNWLTSPSVLPFFIVGVCVSLILLAIKIVRGIVWGS